MRLISPNCIQWRVKLQIKVLLLSMAAMVKDGRLTDAKTAPKPFGIRRTAADVGNLRIC